MTRAEARAVLLAVALWKPRGGSVELLPSDESLLRDELTMEIAPALGLDPEAAMNQMQALRMSS